MLRDRHPGFPNTILLYDASESLSGGVGGGVDGGVEDGGVDGGVDVPSDSRRCDRLKGDHRLDGSFHGGGRWVEMGAVPGQAPVTTITTLWRGMLVVPSGEIRPGVRTTTVRGLDLNSIAGGSVDGTCHTLPRDI